MNRLPLLLLPLLAACTAPMPEQAPTPPGVYSSAFPGPVPAAPAPLPPQVLAALPPGVPSSVVVRNTDGCYLLSIEVTVPPSGYPLRDASGRPVCDAGAAPAALPGMAPAPLLVPGDIAPPSPLAPLNQG